MIKIIKDRDSLLRLLSLDRGKCISYINLNSYPEINNGQNKYSNFYFTVDSYRLAKVLGVEVMSPDNSGYFDLVFSRYYNILFIGGKADEVSSFKDWFGLNFKSKRFEVVNGYLDWDEYELLFLKQQPDLVIVSMGFPIQEELIANLQILDKNTTCTFIASGAFISQTSTLDQSFPKFYTSLNIRWFYRLMHESSARKRFFRVLINFLKLYSEKGNSFRHSIRLQ